MKVGELRAELKKRGLDSKGLKAVLETRLLEATGGGMEKEKGKRKECAAAEPGSPDAKKQKLAAAVDQAARKLLVEAAMTVQKYPGEGGAPDYNEEAVERALTKDPAQCTLADGDRAPPIVTAAAYGAGLLVSSMLRHAGAAAADAVDADGRFALSWAAAFDCDDRRTCCQPCGGAANQDGVWRADGPGGGQCGLRAKIDGCFCILGARRAGKLAVVKLLGERSSAVAVEQALDTAKAVRASFQADVDYHRQDARAARGGVGGEEEDDDDDDEDDYDDDDDDVQVAEDNLHFAGELVAALESMRRE